MWYLLFLLVPGLAIAEQNNAFAEFQLGKEQYAQYSVGGAFAVEEQTRLLGRFSIIQEDTETRTGGLLGGIDSQLSQIFSIQAMGELRAETGTLLGSSIRAAGEWEVSSLWNATLPTLIRLGAEGTVFWERNNFPSINPPLLQWAVTLGIGQQFSRSLFLMLSYWEYAYNYNLSNNATTSSDTGIDADVLFELTSKLLNRSAILDALIILSDRWSATISYSLSQIQTTVPLAHGFDNRLGYFLTEQWEVEALFSATIIDNNWDLWALGIAIHHYW